MALPTDAKDRKGLPMFTGVLAYFPDALAEVARVSKLGNDQHNPGQPLHWARGKSTDQLDCAVRHMIDNLSDPMDYVIDEFGTKVETGYHLAKAAWRILAELQLVLEKSRVDNTGDYVPLPEPRVRWQEPKDEAIPFSAVGPIGQRIRNFGCADGTDF